MSINSTFKLDISCTSDHRCFFELAWSRDNQPATCPADQPVLLHQDLINAYKKWQEAYAKAYEKMGNRTDVSEKPEFPQENSPVQCMSLQGSSLKDLRDDVEETEKQLLLNFHSWLKHKNLEPILMKIETEARRKAAENQRRPYELGWIDLFISHEQKFPQEFNLNWLPWERLSLIFDIKDLPIRIFPRAVSDKTNREIQANITQNKNIKVLALLSTNLANRDQDRDVIESFRKMSACVDIFEHEIGETPDNFKKRLISKLTGERWDILFFAGHSQEKGTESWELQFAADLTLEMNDLKKPLADIANRGLRLAIFNSCCGCRIADFLIEQGVDQVIAMRERIRNDAAHAFLGKLCESLQKYNDVWQAFTSACQYLEDERTNYSSAYLLPTLYRHPRAKLFRFEQSWIKRHWKDWKPSRRELAFLLSCLCLGSLYHLREGQFDVRMLVQAVYSATIHPSKNEETAPVRIIAIDQASINEAKGRIPEFKIKPMERSYLAELVKKSSNQGAKSIGIDYLLETQQPRQGRLNQAIGEAIERDHQFVFAISGKNEVIKETAPPAGSLQGQVDFLPWNIEVEGKCKNNSDCPFAFLLTAIHKANLKAFLRPNGNLSLQQQLDRIHEDQFQLKPGLRWKSLPLGFNYVQDFSIPPDQVYEWTSASEFLNSADNSAQQARLSKQIVIIAAGGDYDDAGDTFSVPLAMNYWCSQPQKTKFCKYNSSDNMDPYSRRHFTGAEAHAYMIYHWLDPKHQVMQIHNFWMILIAALLGKSVIIILRRYNFEQRRQLSSRMLLIGVPVYGVICLPMYAYASVLLPWLFPSFIFSAYILGHVIQDVPQNQRWDYTLSFLGKKFYA
jgi:CHASE2 domain-containing sensor protein